MRTREPITETINATDAKEQWGRILGRVALRETRVIVEENGIPVPAMISARDLERLEVFEAEREEDFKAIDRMREAFKDVPDEELEREIACAIAEVRAENRKREQQGSDVP